MTMSCASQPDSIELARLSLSDLHRLAVSGSIELAGLHVPEGALPPRKMVARALAQLELDTPALWCVPFLIVSTSRSTVLGACGFKTAPVNGSVEISYGIAPEERGRGTATLAIGQLIQLAASSGSVQEVVAHILPRNVASSRVVTRLGFLAEGVLADADGELVTRWVWRPQPGDS